MKRLLSITLIVSLAFIGCRGSPFASSGPGPGAPGGPPLIPEVGLPTAPDQRFEDIPLPVGLQEDIERSYVYESPSLKLGRVVYTSKDDATELANFFLKECKNMGWTEDRRLTAEGYEFTFTKPGKRLSITITKRGMMRGSLVVVNFTPSEGTVSSAF